MFNAKGRLVIAAVLASAFVPVLRCYGSADQRFAPTLQHLQIRLFNVAGVPRHDLYRAEREVIRLFADADIDVNWAEGALNDTAALVTDFSADNSSRTGCRVARKTRDVRLQLLPRAPRGVTTGALGYSLPCAAFGIDTTLFIDRCEDVTYQTHASFIKVLAYAMAHELGHVLLRTSEHTHTGLMRAKWNKSAWLLATVRGIPLDRDLASRMRLELSRMASLPSTTIETSGRRVASKETSWDGGLSRVK